MRVVRVLENCEFTLHEPGSDSALEDMLLVHNLHGDLGVCQYISALDDFTKAALAKQLTLHVSLIELQLCRIRSGEHTSVLHSLL